MGRKPKFLSKDDILSAMNKTRSNLAAARYLHVSYIHYRKYAKIYKDQETGLSLLELHKNQSGKGIPKFLSNKGKEPPLMDVIEGRVPIHHFTPRRIKERIIYEALIEEECSKCGFHERRVLDNKVPLMLHHKNKNLEDFRLENLEFMCYNCSFLYGQSPITDKQIEQMEEYVDKNGEVFDWEIDEHHIEHLKNIGLYDDTSEEDGSEYIAR